LATPPFPYAGEVFSLMTALLWAFAVIIFKKSGENTSPLGLNFFKNSVAFILFLVTMVVLGVPFFQDRPLSIYLLLVTSGIIGIGFADTLFFKSLNILGAARTAIVECLYSPLVILLAFIFLGERLTLWQIAGAALIVFAIFISTYEKQKTPLDRKSLVLGMLFGALAHLLMAVGLIMIKRILEAEPLLWVTEWRMVGGILSLTIILAFHPNRQRVFRSIFDKKSRIYTFSGSIVGAYLVLMTWLGGMKYTKASISSALNQTSTILLFLLAAILLKERLNKEKILGIILAIIGVAMVSFG